MCSVKRLSLKVDVSGERTASITQLLYFTLELWNTFLTMLANFYQTIRRHISEDGTLQFGYKITTKYVYYKAHLELLKYWNTEDYNGGKK
jgi:hypothetical protein